MKGTLYCVGVGPGDPELLTLKALKIIRTCPVLAVPQSRTGVVTAQGILLKALDGCGVSLEDKMVIAMDFPMTRDDQVLQGAHEKAARRLQDELDQGRDVCLITLGCPTVYATSIYVHRLVHEAGYDTEIVPGVPSFCAVAAKLQQPLCEKDEALIVIPGNNAHRKELLGPGRQQGHHEALGTAGTNPGGTAGPAAPRQGVDDRTLRPAGRTGL